MTTLALIALTACTNEATPPPATTPIDEPTPPASMDIVDIASGDEQFSTLVDAVVRVGLEDTLRSEGPFTVFAPTDQAFADLGVDLASLTDEQLTDILLYHVIPADVDSASVPALADSAADLTLFFDTSDGVKVNDAVVTAADIDADNGTIHVVDSVLLPPTILDAAGYAGLTSLADAVGAADPAVADLLGNPGDYTVFAPTNDAFTAAEPITSTLDTAGLTGVLTYHVFEGRVTSDAVPARADSLMVNAYGDNVTALFDTSAGVQINGSDVVIADIKTTNGVVHVVSDVLVPPTVVDHAVNAGLTGLVDAIGAASGDLGTALSDTGPFTVFAPTNTAFDAIADVTATLTADQLADVLLFHVVGGSEPARSGDLSSGEVPTLLAGQSVTVDLSNGVMVEDAMVVDADIHAVNGTVHVIDAVMVPPAE